MNSSSFLPSPRKPSLSATDLAHPFFAGEDSECVVQLVVDGLQNRFELNSRTKPLLLVGRSNVCDISLRHPDVSYRHAFFQLVGGHVHCVDLSSRLGTYWGSERRTAGWVEPGTSVSIGPFSIHASREDESPASDPDSPNSLILASDNLLSRQAVKEFSTREVELVFLNGRRHHGSGQRWTIDRPIVLVGSSSKCRLRLDHPSVSRVHCSLMVTPMGVLATDLLGRGGTLVNDESITFRLLRQGDELRIGEFCLAVDYQESAPNLSGQRRQGTADAFPHPGEQLERDATTSFGLSEEFVLNLVDRLAAMQTQMFCTSHQQMMLIAQLAGTMHQSHHDLVRQELARIGQISEQIRQLQSQVSLHSPGPASDLSARSSSQQLDSAEQAADEGDAGSSSNRQAPGRKALEQSCPPDVARRTDAGHGTSSLIDHGANIPSETERDGEGVWPEAAVAESPSTQADSATPPSELQTGTSDVEPHETAVLESATETPDSATDMERKGRNRLAPADVESHRLLVERMASLERERKSRWKRIVQLLSGTSQ